MADSHCYMAETNTVKIRKTKLFLKDKKIYIYPQFSSVAQSCLTLCDPMNCSMPGLPVHYQIPKFTQTHVHRVRDAIQPRLQAIKKKKRKCLLKHLGYKKKDSFTD